MTNEKLKQNLGMQIGFLLYSGASEEQTIDRMAKIAERYSDEAQTALKEKIIAAIKETNLASADILSIIAALIKNA